MGTRHGGGFLAVVVATVLAGALAACGGGSSSASGGPHATRGSGTAAAPRQGGALTVLENSNFMGEWPGLDPATDTSDAADLNYMNAIYGNLFEQGPDNRIIPDLATGYTFSDGGRTVTIALRRGVTFTDGTPFNAQAVAFNITRDLDPKYACLCDSNFPLASVTTPDDDHVVLHLTRVYAPIIEAFFGEAPNWIISPTALQKMGEKAFAVTPVGAGPFEVASDTLSSVLELKRNPHYWKAGRPYLDSLTFKAVGSDESAYDAVLSGEAGAYEDLSSYQLADQARKHLTVTTIPASLGPYTVQLNTRAAPFDNLVAREVMYYATDPAALDKALAGGTGELTQSMTVKGDLFYEPQVPGYRTYDLAKAKALVKQLGGLSITLDTTSVATGVQLSEALASEWAAAGIKTKINPENLQALVGSFKSGSWQATLGSVGGYDMALGNGLSLRFESSAPFTGVHDPALDAMIAEGAGTLDQSSRAAIYKKVNAYISDHAYAPYLYAVPSYNVAAHGVEGPGLTTPEFFIRWEDVSVGGR